MRNTVVTIAVILLVIGGLLRLYFSLLVLFTFTVGAKEAVTVGLIGDIIGLIGIILIIYGLIAKKYHVSYQP